MWLEDYLSKWDKILFMVSHSQDFMNNGKCCHLSSCKHAYIHIAQVNLHIHTYLSSVHAHRPPHEEEVGILLWHLLLLCENARRKRGGHPNLQYLFIGIHALTFTPPTRTLFFRSERSDTKQSKIRLGLFHYF